jgi:hypothetical protein
VSRALLLCDQALHTRTVAIDVAEQLAGQRHRTAGLREPAADLGDEALHAREVAADVRAEAVRRREQALDVRDATATAREQAAHREPAGSEPASTQRLGEPAAE